MTITIKPTDVNYIPMIYRALFLVFAVVVANAQTTTENYVKTTAYKVATQNGLVDAVSGATITHNHKQETVAYYDGLGRPKQTVAVGVTPSGKDLVSHIGYDAFGRQHRDYLPVPASGSKGSYRDDAEAQTLAYYNTPTFDNTQNPYTERIYEASPLNRVLEVGAPGNKWKADPNSDADKTIKTDYGANSWVDLVRWFEVGFESGDTQRPYLVDKGVYPGGQLYKNTTKDENWRHYTYSQDSNKTETYTNKQGQVILKREFSNRSWHDTYYVYDDYGNLTFVIPPEVQTYASVWQQGDYKYTSLSDYEDLFTTEMNDNASAYGAAYLSSYNKSVNVYYAARNLNGLTPKNGYHFDLSELGLDLPSGALSGTFGYRTAESNQWHWQPISGYLIYNRISISGMPNVAATQIYLRLGRVVGELRNDQPISQFSDQLQTMMYRYRYDHRNRPVERKIPGKDWEYIAYDAQDRPVLTADAQMRAAGQALKTEYDAFDRVTRTGLVTGVNGNSHSAFKAHLSDVIDIVYTQNYYDRYTFDKKGLSLPDNAVTGTQTQGLQTGSRVAILGASASSVSAYSTTLLGYDKKGRLIYTGTHNPAIDVSTQQTHTLDFVGRTLKTTTVETNNGKTLTKVDDYAYDPAGRLIDHDLTLNEQKEDLTHNTYDELGQLAQKTVGGGLQTVDYAYNIRGWLRKINNPDALNNDLFGFEIDYGYLYNGNIQSTHWATANDHIKHRYQYGYDGLNRLTRAYHNAPGMQWGAYNAYISYDRNGNIRTLYRRGAENIGIDNLRYLYQGNQLLAVTDYFKHSEGFDDGNTNGFDYLYDANGNLKEDKNKGIAMQYNHLNLPTKITKGSQHLLYSYDATGVKLQKTMGTQTTTYTPTAVYKNNELEFIHTPEGYAQPTADGFEFVYQYKDHLGNVRLTYADNDTNGSINPLTEIIAEKNYYPFGLAHKGYNNVVKSSNLGENWKFNGKEEESELGLNTYDFGARNYDASIGRWNQIDPLAEGFYSYSTYNAMMNNPLRFIDPDGMAPDDWIPKLNEDGSTSYIAEKGDSASTLSSQYGISQNDAEAITGTTGDTKIAAGTEVSGQDVANVTGSEVLKLDIASKEGQSEQRRFEQFLYARDHSTTKGGFAFLNTDYFSNTAFMNTMEGSATMQIEGNNISVKYQIPMYRSGTLDGSSTSVGLSNTPFKIKNTSGVLFRGNQANIELELYHPNGNYSNQQYRIFTTRNNSNNVYKRLSLKFPQYNYSRFKSNFKN